MAAINQAYNYAAPAVSEGINRRESDDVWVQENWVMNAIDHRY